MLGYVDVVSFTGTNINKVFSDTLSCLSIQYSFVDSNRWLEQEYLSFEEPCVIVLDQGFSSLDGIRQRIGDNEPGLYCIIWAYTESLELNPREVKDLSIIPLDVACKDQVQELVSRLIQTHMQFTRQYINRNVPPLIAQNMIGHSEAFLDVVSMIDKVSNNTAGVYIHGETGTGKELVARSIHYMSGMCDGPFIPVNCGALSNDLMLSELFGHEKGAFTGATKQHIGLIEQANNGTLFLDEVDSLSEKAQVTLLRYLQEHEFRPLGGQQVKYSNARILVASNASLDKLSEAGTFRMDLFFRLNILRIDLPPLRERKMDFFLLSQLFLRNHSAEHGAIKVLHPDILRWMAKHTWPGNIRELENFIYRAYLLNEGTVITHVPGVVTNQSHEGNVFDESTKIAGLSAEKKRVLNEFEKQYILKVLKKTGGNISSAAKLADKERSSFSRLMKKYGINRNQFVT